MVNIELILNYLPFLLWGAWVTIQISAITSIIGFVLGTVLGILQSGTDKVLSTLITIYTTIIRGTPMLIQIFFFSFATPLGLFWGPIIAIGLNSSAYVCNIIRSGIAAVGKGQIEAAKVLGLSNFQIVRYIILPQAIRTVLPSLGNELITLTKDSSLASTVGAIMELTMRGKIVASETYDFISIYAIVAILYLIMTTTISIFFIKLEQRTQYYAEH